MSRYNDGSGVFSMAEFSNRGVIKLAPDALVYISTSVGTTVISPVSGKEQKMSFEDGITSINVQNNIDPPGSSTATIEIATSIYDERSKYWMSFRADDGLEYRIPIFVPMMEVKVYFKGRFLVGDQPRYYPAFWGFITNVEESYSGGLYKITLQCGDMLHWWNRMVVNISPSVESNIVVGGTQNISVWSTKYKEANPFEIIQALFKEMGFENFVTPSWLGNKTPLYQLFPEGLDRIIQNVVFSYWGRRFGVLTNYLRMYGAGGHLINNPRLPLSQTPSDEQHNPKDTVEKGVEATASSVKDTFLMDDQFVSAYKIFGAFADFASLETAEYKTKLELATEIKNRVEYEFFQDTNGNFVFKPPFYNLDTRALLPYRIKPSDIMNYSSSINSDEIVSVLEVQTTPNSNFQTEGSPINPKGYHIDLDLMAKYGAQYRAMTLWWVGSTSIAQSVAVGHLSLINAKAYSATITIPGRPEMRLGYPIYLEHKDRFHYVRSISHTFDYGSTFTTTLSLEAERSRVYAKDNFGNWEIQKFKIYKQKSKLFKKPDEKADNTKTDKQKEGSNKGDPFAKIDELYRGANILQSNSPGRYEIVSQETPEQSIVQNNTIPYTDEEGYRVIGGFRYGRGIIVKPGTVVDNFEEQATKNNTAAEITTEHQNQMITNMKTGAEEEGNFMKQYFRVNVQEGVESAVPDYKIFNDSKKRDAEPMSNEQAAAQVTLAKP